MELTWLGRSCFQVITRYQKRILFDPFLEWYRERELSPFPPPDMLCISHGHLDHFADVPDLIRGDSPAIVVAVPGMCRALGELIPETQNRLFPLSWGDQFELERIPIFAFRSPPMRTSLYDMFEEFGVSKVLDFLRSFRQVADEILYLPLTSFGIKVDGFRLLHFTFEGESDGGEVDVQGIGQQFVPDVALVSVERGQERRSAEYAAALGAPMVIPHHFHAYMSVPPADLDAFARELARLAPNINLRVLDVTETVKFKR